MRPFYFLEKPLCSDLEPSLHQSDVQFGRQRVVALLAQAVFQRRNKGLKRINRQNDILRDRTLTDGKWRKNRGILGKLRLGCPSLGDKFWGPLEGSLIYDVLGTIVEIIRVEVNAPLNIVCVGTCTMVLPGMNTLPTFNPWGGVCLCNPEGVGGWSLRVSLITPSRYGSLASEALFGVSTSLKHWSISTWSLSSSDLWVASSWKRQVRVAAVVSLRWSASCHSHLLRGRAFQLQQSNNYLLSSCSQQPSSMVWTRNFQVTRRKHLVAQVSSVGSLLNQEPYGYLV